jgi:iron complex transport system permease protein
MLFLLLLFGIASTLHLSLGAIYVDPITVLLKGFSEGTIFSYRLDRWLAAISVGVLLSLSGLLVQTAVRNPLGDPYLLGISSGSLFAISLTFILPLQGMSLLLIRPFSAFIGGMVAYMITHIIALRVGYTPTTLVLSGVAVGTTMYSLSLLPQYLLGREVYRVFLWSMGTLVEASKIVNLQLFAIVLFVLIIALMLLRYLNALMLGDDFVKELGRNPKNIRAVALVLAAFSASVTVAWYGIIGFVGLAAPHIARYLLRTGDMKYVLPVSMLAGPVIVLFSDTIAKYVFQPMDLPLNIIVSIIGGPALAAVLISQGRRYAQY